MGSSGVPKSIYLILGSRTRSSCPEPKITNIQKSQELKIIHVELTLSNKNCEKTQTCELHNRSLSKVLKNFCFSLHVIDRTQRNRC
jgi:hypothetical protein